MANPIITITDSTSATLSALSFGIVDIDAVSDEETIWIWNNKGGIATVSDAISATVTTKTYNGLNVGDTIPNGQEVITNRMLEACVTSLGESDFTAIGGSTVHFIGDAVTGVLYGDIGGSKSVVKLRLNVPASTTPGEVGFYLRINYLFV